MTCSYHPKNSVDAYYQLRIDNPDIQQIGVNEGRGKSLLEVFVDRVPVKLGGTTFADHGKVSNWIGEAQVNAMRRGSELSYIHKGKTTTSGTYSLNGSAKALHSVEECKRVHKQVVAENDKQRAERRAEVARANAAYHAKVNDHCSKDSISRFEKRSGNWRFYGNGGSHSVAVTELASIMRLEQLLRDQPYLTRSTGVVYASSVPEVCP